MHGRPASEDTGHFDYDRNGIDELHLIEDMFFMRFTHRIGWKTCLKQYMECEMSPCVHELASQRLSIHEQRSRFGSFGEGSDDKESDMFQRSRPHALDSICPCSDD